MANYYAANSSNSRFEKVYYKDLNSQYTMDNRQLVLTNVEAVNNELLNLIMISPGEVDFEPDFGCEVPNLLFEQPSGVVNWMMGNILFIAIGRWLPYVQIDTKDSYITELSNAVGYYFKLYVSIVGLNASNVNFSFKT